MNKQIIFGDEIPRSTLNQRLDRGGMRRLARGIYTDDLNSDPTILLRRNWAKILGHEFPGAVVSDRSAPAGGPVDDVLYVVHTKKRRDLDLPGLTISARQGSGPLPDDIPLPDGAYLASRARALVENTIQSRARGGKKPRTLTDDELADWVNRLCGLDGEERLAGHRTRAEEIADELGAPDGVGRLSQMIGAALGSRKIETASVALSARQLGVPIDPDRIDRFDRLLIALRSTAPQSRNGLEPDSKAFQTQAFFEAYFSNYIEGTIFSVDEAARIVFEGEEIENRSADSHDVAGTFAVVANPDDMLRRFESPDEYIEVLRQRHATILAGRPGQQPGEYKTIANRAGNTEFVHPSLVHGTLLEGFRRASELDSAWERSTYVGFVVAEVHPFEDGNGRAARAMMSGELTASGQSKIIVPTGFRSQYLGALRRLSRQDDPEVWIKTMRFLHDWTAQIDWTTFESALADLKVTNAFSDDDDGPQIRLLRDLDVPAVLDIPDDDTPQFGFVSPYLRNGRTVSGYRKPPRSGR